MSAADRGAGKGQPQQQQQQYTPILPAPLVATQSSSSGSSNLHQGPSRAPELPPKRQKRAGAGRFACDACRLRKSACDGQQPSCSTCAKRRVTCVYAPAPRLDSALSQEEHAELERLRKQKASLDSGRDSEAAALLADLQTLPEDQALVLFHRLRAAGARGSGHLLMIRHPVSYPVVSAKPIVLHVAGATGFLDGPEHDGENVEHSFTSRLTTIDPSTLSLPLLERPKSPVAPKQPAFCDDRLRLFDVYNWLDVPASPELAAAAISFYLTTSHPILGLFDVDLFLHDLVARETNFCSPLLLSAILAVACGYTAIEPTAAGLSHDFFAEAERLYGEERTRGPQYESATMTTAAALLLCLAASGHSREEVAFTYLRAAIQMAHNNGLLVPNERHQPAYWTNGDIDNVRAAAHTAWGTFCTAILYGVNYWNALIDMQPWLPIPGTHIDRGDGSVTAFPLPAYMGSSFTELCKLAPLINRTLHQYRVSPAVRSPFPLAAEIYTQLLAWADSLPIAMGHGMHMPHHAAFVHIQFHVAVLDLFRPSRHQNPKLSLELARPLAAAHRSVEDACLASTNQLKNLVLVFRTRHRGSATSSVLWQNAMLYVANDCFATLPQRPPPPPPHQVNGGDSTTTTCTDDDANDTRGGSSTCNRRIWFLACIDGYKELAPQFRIVSGILQGLLSMGIVHGLITAAEGRAHMAGVGVGAGAGGDGTAARHPSSASASSMGGGGGGGGGEQQQQQQQQRWIMPSMGGAIPPVAARARGNTFIVDLNGAMADPHAASVEALARSFRRVAGLFDGVQVGVPPVVTAAAAAAASEPPPGGGGGELF